MLAQFRCSFVFISYVYSSCDIALGFSILPAPFSDVRSSLASESMEKELPSGRECLCANPRVYHRSGTRRRCWCAFSSDMCAIEAKQVDT